MLYSQLKEKLIGLFDSEKLQAFPSEWGFYNEKPDDHPIKIIGFATNIAPEIIEEADRLHVDMLITHHDSWPFIDGMKQTCNALLIEYGIIHAYFHAPLDDADFGTSGALAAAIELLDIEKTVLMENAFYCGRIGRLAQPCTFADFAVRFSRILEEDVRRFQNSDNLVYHVCIVAGGGNMTDVMKTAVDGGCDTYITGEYSLYSQQYAKLHGLHLLVGSHTNTEILGVQSLCGKLVEGTSLSLVRIKECNY